MSLLFPPVPIMIAPIVSQSATVGRNVIFVCNITAGDDGSITYSWERNAEPLNDDERVTGNETDTLTIVGVTDADEGGYTCTATSARGVGGSTSSNSAMLTICKSQYIYNGRCDNLDE